MLNQVLLSRTTVGTYHYSIFLMLNLMLNLMQSKSYWRYDFDTDVDLFNIPPIPDKSDDKDPDNMLNCPHSNYYSLTQLNQLFDSTT